MAVQPTLPESCYPCAGALKWRKLIDENCCSFSLRELAFRSRTLHSAPTKTVSGAFSKRRGLAFGSIGVATISNRLMGHIQADCCRRIRVD